MSADSQRKGTENDDHHIKGEDIGDTQRQEQNHGQDAQPRRGRVVSDNVHCKRGPFPLFPLHLSCLLFIARRALPSVTSSVDGMRLAVARRGGRRDLTAGRATGVPDYGFLLDSVEAWSRGKGRDREGADAKLRPTRL